MSKNFIYSITVEGAVVLSGEVIARNLPNAHYQIGQLVTRQFPELPSHVLTITECK